MANKILYVEDRQAWLSTVGGILSRAGYEPLLFDDIDKAREHYQANHSEIALVICDGSINSKNDGRDWAIELHGADKKAVVLSTDPATGVPFVSKSPLDGDELLRTIAEVLGQ